MLFQEKFSDDYIPDSIRIYRPVASVDPPGLGGSPPAYHPTRLYAFTPRPDRPTRGLAPEEIQRVFAPAFAVEREEGGDDPTGPRPAWYWLRRLGQG